MKNEELFWKYQPLVSQTRRRLVKRCRSNEDLVADIEQEGVIGLIEALDRWDPKGGASLRTYLILRIRNSMISHLRYEKRNRSVTLESFEDIPSDSFGDPADIVISKLTSDWLESQLGKLTDHQREVAICRYWYGLTNEETSQYLGTTRSRVSQLDLKVKQCLRDAV